MAKERSVLRKESFAIVNSSCGVMLLALCRVWRFSVSHFKLSCLELLHIQNFSTEPSLWDLSSQCFSDRSQMLTVVLSFVSYNT